MEYSAPQIAGRDEPFRPAIREHLKGHTQGLEDLAIEMLARVRDIEDAFKDETGRFFGDLAGLAEPQSPFSRRLAELRRLNWVVYAKPPFGGPQQVLAYLSRYTHRVAIANSRLNSLSDGTVRFTARSTFTTCWRFARRLEVALPEPPTYRGAVAAAHRHPRRLVRPDP